MSDFEDIAQLIEALRPWLGHLVIVGGWAHRLHRFHPLADPPKYLPIQTRDADVAFELNAPIEGDIDDALKEAGFKAELKGEHTPPVTHYWLDEQDQGFYAEFLAPFTGSRLNRDKTPAPVTVSKAGVTAQKLRYLDILLIHSWAIGLGESVGVPLKSPAEILIPNPVSFIAQKLLIQSRRPSEKKAQDAIYIHDTLELFGANLDQLKIMWCESIRPRIHPKIVTDIETLSRTQFGNVNDIIRDAARIPPTRTLDPDLIQKACELGLEEIFGN